MLRAGGAGAMGGRPKSGVPGPLAACLLPKLQPPVAFATPANPSLLAVRGMSQLLQTACDTPQ
jgi:hypothetical protein